MSYDYDGVGSKDNGGGEMEGNVDGKVKVKERKTSSRNNNFDGNINQRKRRTTGGKVDAGDSEETKRRQRRDRSWRWGM